MVDYGDDEVEGSPENAGVDHVIEVVNEVARLLSQNSNTSSTADGREDI